MKIEYASIRHYPLLARLIQDPEVVKLFTKLGQDSIQYTSEMVKMMLSLGANPEE